MSLNSLFPIFAIFINVAIFIYFELKIKKDKKEVKEIKKEVNEMEESLFQLKSKVNQLNRSVNH